MDKTYTMVGWSMFRGELKLRFTNDTARAKTLDRKGHRDVVLLDLPGPMVRIDAIRWLSGQEGVPENVRALTLNLLRDRLLPQSQQPQGAKRHEPI